MTKNDIIRMAQEAGLRVGPSRDGPDDVWGVGANLERFAALVADHVAEEIFAMVAEQGWGWDAEGMRHHWEKRKNK